MPINANDTIKIRVRFSRKGVAKFLSHLDEVRTISRAISRSGLPIWHTEGFNPHPYIVFSNPLSVGFAAECEIMDMRLNEIVPMETVVEKLNTALPADFRVKEAYIRETKPNEIAYARYEILFTAYGFSAKELSNEVEEMLSRDEIWVLKSAKRSTAETNIKPMIKEYTLKTINNDLHISVVLSASQTEYINPEYLFSAMERYIKNFELDYKEITRSVLYNAFMTEFK